MKSVVIQKKQKNKSRRPRKGAWIEIAFRNAVPVSLSVAPARGRGLKSAFGPGDVVQFGRPRKGAWIEIQGFHNLPVDVESPPQGGVD